MKRLCGLLAGWLVLLSTCAAIAAEETKPAAGTPQKKEAPDESPPARDFAPAKGFQFQELEDPVAPLKPVRARTPEEQKRIDAVSWYTAGRVLETRGESQAALNAYRKAAELDPQALVVLRALISLTRQLNLGEETAQWALKALELDPSDYQLLQGAVDHLVRQGDLSGATRLLEKATQAPQSDKRSPTYVLLMRTLGVIHYELGRKNEAADSFEPVFDALLNPEKYHLDDRTLKMLTDHATSNYERIGQVFLDGNKTDLALQAFQKAAETKKGSAANLSYNLALVYTKSEQPEKALEELQKYIDAQRQSKGRAAYELLAELLKKLNKADEVIPRLETAAKADARNAVLHYFLADQYLAAKRLEDAERTYKETLQSSEELQGYVGLAAVYRQQQKPSELIEALGKGYSQAGDLKGLADELEAVVADEKLAQSVLETGEKYAAEDPPKFDFATGYVLANLAADAKKTDLAEKLYRLLLTLRKDRAALVLEELGQLLSEARKYAEAAKVFEEAANNPDLADARANFLFQLTHALELAGDTTKALETIAAAQQLLPNNPLLLYEEAWVYYHSNQFDTAIAKFEKIVADFANTPAKTLVRRVQFSLSNIYVMQGNIRKGEEILEVVYKEAPDDPTVNNDLGYLYADQGKNLEQAEKMIRKAIAAEPENGAYLDSMGWVLYKLGKYDDALPYLEKAVKKSTGGDETLWDHLGDLYDRLQQADKARDAWTKALEAAKKATKPDQKLIEKVEAKLGKGGEK
jgi:tetratricopeptide (TPR) repeat protein